MFTLTTSTGLVARPHPNSGAIVDDPRSSSSPDLPGLDHHPDGPNVIPGTFFTSANVYSVETLAIAITTSIVTSLVVGFISGYIFARRWKNDIDVDSGPEDYTR